MAVGQRRVVEDLDRRLELLVLALELLKREIEVLKVCQHPSIIRFFDVFESQDYIQIVMELLRGGDPRQVPRSSCSGELLRGSCKGSYSGKLRRVAGTNRDQSEFD